MKIKQLIVLSILVFQSASEADNSMILLGGDLIFANGFELESLVINEIDYDQPGSDTEEFIEIYNPTSSEISLNGIRLYLVNGGTFSDYDEYFFSDLGSMQPGQYLVVGSNSVLTSLPPGTISMPLNGSIQNGSSDGVVLIDTSDNSIIDSVSYEGNLTGVTITDLSITIDITEGTSSLTDTIDGSLSRIPNGEDSNNNDADFLFTSSTTPGSQNAEVLGPEFLVINELDYDQPGSDTVEFIEIYNPTASEISLIGARLYLTNGGTFSDYDQYDFSAFGNLQAGQYLVIGSSTVLSSVPPGTLTMLLNGNIQNGNADGVVMIDTSDNSIIDSMSYEGNLTGVTITDLSIVIDITEGTSSLSDTGDGSLSRIPNGLDMDNNDLDFTLTTTITPGAANVN